MQLLFHVGRWYINRVMFRCVCVSDTSQHISDFISNLHDVNLLCSCLPARLFHARDLAFVCQFSEANSANAEFAKICVWSAADFTSIICASREFRCSCLTYFFDVLATEPFPPYFANGAPMSLSSSRDSSSVVAVVTNAMSIPRTLSILSYSISGKINCSFRPRL